MLLKGVNLLPRAISSSSLSMLAKASEIFSFWAAKFSLSQRRRATVICRIQLPRAPCEPVSLHQPVVPEGKKFQ